MKRIYLFLALFLPIATIAQVNDIYFVPTKEKKVVVVKSSEVNSFADIDDNYISEEKCDVDTIEADAVYFTNDLYDLYYDDYDYSTRIVRFRSPARLMGTGLYWDLRYNSGINDWLVYDNGITIDIYPTSNNLFYYYAGCGMMYYNPSAWHVHYNAFTPYWAWRPSWYWHDFHWHNNYWHSPYWYNHHWHNHHWHAGYNPPHHGNNNYWRPTHKVHRDIPTNGGVARNERENQSVSTNGDTRGNERGGTATVRTQRPRRTVNDSNVTNGAVSSSDSRGGSTPTRIQQPRRGVSDVETEKKTETTGLVRQQPQRGMNNANVRENNVSKNDRGGNPVRRSGTGNSNSRSEGGNSYRSGGNSSGNNNRSGNTGVSRSGSTSGSSRGGSVSGGYSRGGSSGSSRGSSGARR